MNWLLRRLARYAYQRAMEASTWRNVILLAGGTWSARHPEQAELLIPICLAVAGFVGSFFPDLLGSARLEARRDEAVSALLPIDLMGQPQGYNDANPNVGETPIYPIGRPGADVDSQNSGIYQPGPAPERGGVAADQLRQSVSSNNGLGADTQPKGFDESHGWGNK